jgi:hypothetical protein
LGRGKGRRGTQKPKGKSNHQEQKIKKLKSQQTIVNIALGWQNKPPNTKV